MSEQAGPMRTFIAKIMVSSCGNCPFQSGDNYYGFYCGQVSDLSTTAARKAYDENSQAITDTCPGADKLKGENNEQAN